MSAGRVTRVRKLMSTDRMYIAGPEADEHRPLTMEPAFDPLKLDSAECRIYVCLLKSAM